MILEGADPSYPIRDESIVAAILLGLALLQMPHAYYDLMRWILLFVGGSIALHAPMRHVKAAGAALAILFNPFIPIEMSRPTWVIIDIFLAIGILHLGLSTREIPEIAPEEEMIAAPLEE